MFFQSLLPSFSLQQQGQQLNYVGENGAVAQMVPGGVQGQQQQQHEDIAGGQQGDNEGNVFLNCERHVFEPRMCQKKIEPLILRILMKFFLERLY